MKALEIFNRGDIGGATEAALEFVRNNPKDSGAREVLAEFLCFRGQFEKADRQLETLLVQDPKSVIVASLVRQLIRAETARRECWKQGRVPEFLGEPDASMQNLLLAAVKIREGQLEQAAEHAAAAEELRPVVAGVCNGKPFSDFRDLDDLCGGILEVLTSTGKYFWIPMSRVISVEFEAPLRPRDLLWRQCQMEVESGPHGVVYLPVTYAGPTAGDPTAEIALGRTTEWTSVGDSIVCGAGQKMFAVDDEDFSLLELESLSFGQADAPE